MMSIWGALIIVFYCLVIGAIIYAIMSHIGRFLKFSEFLEAFYHKIMPYIKKLIKK